VQALRSDDGEGDNKEASVVQVSVAVSERVQGEVMLFIEREYLPVVLKHIREAAVSIEACCYEWSWYAGQRMGSVQGVNRELGYAVKRGVKVRCLMHNEPPRGHLGKINRRTAHELKVLGCEVKMGGTEKILHAKFWIFDREKAIVCTHNISNRAANSNAEVGVVVEDPGDILKLANYYDKLWVEHGR